MSELAGFEEADQEVYLDHIRNGMQRGAAAEAMGLDRKKMREYIATHREFEVLIEDAEVDATEHVMEALYQAAINGSVAAARTWIDLKNGPQEEAPRRSAVKPPSSPSPRPDDNFSDLDNVAPIEPRRRRRDGQD